MKVCILVIFLLLVFFLFVIFFPPSQTPSKQARDASYNSNFQVTLYSGGVAVEKWESSGKPLKDNGSFYFLDSKKNCFVEISGDISIIELNPEGWRFHGTKYEDGKEKAIMMRKIPEKEE